jgi:excisionase family DNA binding protein
MLDAFDEYPDILTVAEVAQILRVDRSYVYRIIREGRLPALRPTPSKTRVVKAELSAFLDATRTTRASGSVHPASTPEA